VRDDPAGDATVEGERVLQDERREAVARKNGAQQARVAIDAIDREVVVGDHRLERVCDEVEDLLRVERREEALVERKQLALARERMLAARAGYAPLVTDPPHKPVGEGQHDRRLRERHRRTHEAGEVRHPTHDVSRGLARHARAEGEDEHSQEAAAAHDRHDEEGACQRHDRSTKETVRERGARHYPEGHEHDARDQQQPWREAPRVGDHRATPLRCE
jgi:hypothetical protein